MCLAWHTARHALPENDADQLCPWLASHGWSLPALSSVALREHHGPDDQQLRSYAPSPSAPKSDLGTVDLLAPHMGSVFTGGRRLSPAVTSADDLKSSFVGQNLDCLI